MVNSKHMGQSHNNHTGSRLKDIILGGQDGVVNVLGLVLGVAVATNDTRVVLVAGLASTFAESISMAAVAYTSTKAALGYYYSELAHEEREIKEMPKQERKEIRQIYAAKGFRGRILSAIVNKITSNKKLWLDTMMAEELKLTTTGNENPANNAFIVGISSLIGSLIPLLPFFFLPVKQSIYSSLALCSLVLFATGAYKARVTVGRWWKSGLEMLFIGMLAALAGYLIGLAFGAVA